MPPAASPRKPWLPFSATAPSAPSVVFWLSVVACVTQLGGLVAVGAGAVARALPPPRERTIRGVRGAAAPGAGGAEPRAGQALGAGGGVACPRVLIAGAPSGRGPAERGGGAAGDGGRRGGRPRPPSASRGRRGRATPARCHARAGSR